MPPPLSSRFRMSKTHTPCSHSHFCTCPLDMLRIACRRDSACTPRYTCSQRPGGFQAPRSTSSQGTSRTPTLQSPELVLSTCPLGRDCTLLPQPMPCKIPEHNPGRTHYLIASFLHHTRALSNSSLPSSSHTHMRRKQSRSHSHCTSCIQIHTKPLPDLVGTIGPYNLIPSTASRIRKCPMTYRYHGRGNHMLQSSWLLQTPDGKPNTSLPRTAPHIHTSRRHTFPDPRPRSLGLFYIHPARRCAIPGTC